jgi:3-mercaptopyruvate sulfurtransferase SseA
MEIYMKIKKITVMILVVFMMAIVLVGCGKSLDDSKEEDVKSEKVEKNKVFVSPEWVKSVVDGNQPESDNYTILEVSMGKFKDSPTYTKGYIPGALHVDTASVESETYWNISEPEVVEKGMLDLGVTKDKTVILCFSYSKSSACVSLGWSIKY